MFHKKVELTELFFDLVFVYAISQMTSLIHHLHHGVVPTTAFISYIISLVVLVNTWMIQTVFTNRYGENSLRNIAFMLVSMAMVLGLSNTFSSDWSDTSNFYTYSFLVIGLNAVLCIQYMWEYFRRKDDKNRQVIRFFNWLLAARTLLLLLCLLFPYPLAAWLSFAVIVLTTLTPMLFTKLMGLVPTNFPHLLERLSLLVIITFGEMLIGIAPYFKADTFSWLSIMVFLIVANLFMFYIIEVDHLIDETGLGATGNALIYMHYLIFIGLGMVTVSLAFFREEAVNHTFLLLFLFVGLALFYLGTLLLGIHNKESHRLTKPLLLSVFGLCLLGLLASILFSAQLLALALIVTMTIALITLVLLRFNLKRRTVEK